MLQDFSVPFIGFYDPTNTELVIIVERNWNVCMIFMKEWRKESLSCLSIVIRHGGDTVDVEKGDQVRRD